jgi:hypothetical protein
MQDIEILLSGIEFKIRNLLNLQKKLKTENSKLRIENGELRINLDNLNIKIKELEEKNRVLRISKKIDTEKDGKELRLKINEIVREVDKCMSFLNR